jgi:hypothetical protein
LTHLQRVLLFKEGPPIHEIYKALTGDEARNGLIVRDVLNAVSRGRSPLVLTERIDHLNLLAARLESSVKNLIVLGLKGHEQEISTRELKDPRRVWYFWG